MEWRMSSTKAAHVWERVRGGYIDEHDRLVVKLPEDCTFSGDFKEGLAWFGVRGQKWGCFDRDGKVIIKPKYDDVGGFSGGLAPVNVGGKRYRGRSEEGGKWGYVDRSGREVIPLQFDWAWDFVDGFAEVEVGEETFVIDTAGKRVSRPAPQPKVAKDLPPLEAKTLAGGTSQVNARCEYRGKLARVHIGGQLDHRCDAPPVWHDGAWFYVNRGGAIVPDGQGQPV